jgi:signal transduction histidine kinase
MAETQPLEQQHALSEKTNADQAAPLVRRPDWQLYLSASSGRLEAFQLVEWTIIITAYLFYFVDGTGRAGAHWLAWTAAIGGFVLVDRAEPWLIAHDRPGLCIVLRVAFATWAVWLSDIGFLTTFLFFIIVANGWAIERRLGILAAIGSAVAIYGAMFLLVGFDKPDRYISLLPWLAGLGFIGGMTQLTKREQEARERSDTLLTELTVAHCQLQIYAEQAGELATTQERNRLAREIHDSLGHYLTIINIQLETARALRPRDDVRADRAVGEAKRLASEALADVRRSVAALRPTALEHLSISDAVTAQVADFHEHSGLLVDLAIDGDERRCSQATGLALYRTVQEGLTNIRKHAAAQHVAVRLHFGPATTVLTITDDGRGFVAANHSVPRPDGSGFGLAGIRERIVLLDGTLDVGPGPTGGTMLRATVPCKGER